jgi:hypothetical protein
MRTHIPCQVNGHEFTYTLHVDAHDEERHVACVYSAHGELLSVGDGPYGEYALEDALWDALGEVASTAE